MISVTEKYIKNFLNLYNERMQPCSATRVDIILDYGESELIIETKTPYESRYHIGNK